MGLVGWWVPSGSGTGERRRRGCDVNRGIGERRGLVRLGRSSLVFLWLWDVLLMGVVSEQIWGMEGRGRYIVNESRESHVMKYMNLSDQGRKGNQKGKMNCIDLDY